MKNIYTCVAVVAGICGLALHPGALLGQAQITGTISKDRELPKIAVPDFRGSGDAQKWMDGFNTTLWNELDDAGVLKPIPKTSYPLDVPQRPQDFHAPLTQPSAKRGQPPITTRGGPWLTDWSNPPVSADNLAFGYTGVQDNRLVLFGWLFNLRG